MSPNIDGGIKGQSEKGWDGETWFLWEPRRSPEPAWWVVQEGFLKEATATLEQGRGRTVEHGDDAGRMFQAEETACVKVLKCYF